MLPSTDALIHEPCIERERDLWQHSKESGNPFDVQMRADVHECIQLLRISEVGG